MKTGITTKLLSIVALAALGFILLSGIALQQMRAMMIQDRIAKVRNLSEVARDMVKDYDLRAKAGEFDLATAQAMARATLQQLRYSGDEYYFAYDWQGNNTAHGSKPERVGKNFLESKDSNGYAYIPDLIAAARKGGGAVFYMYPRLGSDVPERKVSYAVSYDPWQWMIGTGIYVDDVDKEFRSEALELAGIVAAVLAVFTLLVVVLARNIGGAVTSLAGVTQRLAAHDYAVEVPGGARADEIGQLARAITSLRDTAAEADDLRRRQEEAKAEAEAERRAALLRVADGFEGSVKRVAENITAASGQLEGAAQVVSQSVDSAGTQATSVAAAAEQASANVETVATAAEELSASIQEISRQVQQSSTVSAQAVSEAQHTDELVRGLADAATRIGEVVGMINQIAGQTNLLALNATIEAARAGDAGKGFAVVANEVKALANQTGKATEDISAQISAVQDSTRQAVDAIRAIVGTITRINEIAGAIAAAVEEQGAATAEIARNVQEASTGTQQVTSFLGSLSMATAEAGNSASGMLSATRDLAAEAVQLRQEVQNFLAGIRAG